MSTVDPSAAPSEGLLRSGTVAVEPAVDELVDDIDDIDDSLSDADDEIDGDPERSRPGPRVPRRRRALVVAAAMTWYPVLFMLPVLRWGSRSHLRSPVESPDQLTDLDAAIRLAWALDRMPYPWSISADTLVPTGESIWRWQTYTQSIQVVGLWVLTRVFPPALSVNLLVLLGWILTGVAAYMLARTLGASARVAIVAGVLCQMIPSMATMGSNFTSYVYIAVPLAVLTVAIRTMTEPSWRKLFLLGGCVAATAFFDAYWLYFSAVAVVVAAAVNFRTIVAWLREQRILHRVLLASTLIVPFLMLGLVLLADRSSQAAGSRPLEVANAGLVDAGLRSPRDWFRWTYEGLGLAIPVLAIGYSVYRLRSRRDARVTTAIAICLTMILLSTRTRIPLGIVEIGPLAEYARQVMPGVRFFQRAALIAEAMMVVLAVLGLRELLVRVPAGGRRVALGLGAFAVLVLSLSPLTGRVFFDPPPAYAEARAILAETDDPVVAALPMIKHGRAWFELSMLDVASVNPLSGEQPAAELALAASHGPEAFAAALDGFDATHLLVAEGRDGLPLGYELEAPRFTKRLTFFVSGFENPRQLVHLYEVEAQEGDTFCSDCPPGNGLDLVRRVTVTGTTYPAEPTPDGGRAWWMFGPHAEVVMETYDLPFTGTVQLRLGSSPCGTPRTVTVTHVGESQSVEVSGIEVVELEVPVTHGSLTLPIEIEVDGPVCQLENDYREFMLYVIRPELNQAELTTPD